MSCRRFREVLDRRMPESGSGGYCMGSWLALRTCCTHRSTVRSGFAARAIRDRRRPGDRDAQLGALQDSVRAKDDTSGACLLQRGPRKNERNCPEAAIPARTDTAWPTHACPAEFWEELGRTIAAFGFLEDSLQRANLAITATREYRSVQEAEAAFETWERELDLSMDETLGALVRRFMTALKDDERYSPTDEDEIERRLKPVAWWRNALCHGAWTDYDSRSGCATLRYWPKKKRREEGDRPISRHDLVRIRHAAVELTILVIDAVTSKGIRFPGSDSPGKPVLRDHET